MIHGYDSHRLTDSLSSQGQPLTAIDASMVPVRKANDKYKIRTPQCSMAW